MTHSLIQNDDVREGNGLLNPPNPNQQRLVSLDSANSRPRQSEKMTVDPQTGGQKAIKLERFDLIPSEFESALARHYGKGAEKYADRNWERGYRWSLSVGALRRHLALWLEGESIDAETGSNHLIAVAWHAIALFIFELRGLGTDDIRRKKNA